MTSILNMRWSDLVKAVARERREKRDADNRLFDEISTYLGGYDGEEIEGLVREMADPRRWARKNWRGECAFSFRVEDGKVYVRKGDNEQAPWERFDNREPAYRRMAEHLLDLKERARPTAAA